MAISNNTAVQAFRLSLLTLVVSALVLPGIWQPLISAAYRSLCRSSLYRLSFFETVETMLCYIIIEPIYTAIFARNPGRRVDIRFSKTGESSRDLLQSRSPLPKMVRPSRRLREMLIYAGPLLLLDLTLIKKYGGVDVKAIRQSGGYAAEPPAGTGGSRLGISAHFLAPTLHNFTWGSPLQMHRMLPLEPPSSRRIVSELATSFFLYDALFFAIHILFHRVPALHRIHGPHHKHNEIHPQVTNRLSVAERLALILLANFSLNIIGSHVLTRTCFIPLFVYLLIEVHSGVNLDWQCDKILPQGWGAGARKHALHHREGKRFFQPFFCWWDDALERWERMDMIKSERRRADKVVSGSDYQIH